MKFSLIYFLTSFSLIAKPITAPQQFYTENYREFLAHPKSFYPFINESSFIELADHLLDPSHLTFDPEVVKEGDIIYVGVWLLDWLLKVAFSTALDLFNSNADILFTKH
jgi:hypothetical protein